MLRSEQCICESQQPSEGWLSIDLAELPAVDNNSMLTVTHLNTGAQQVLGFARFRHCFPIAAGDYRLAIHSYNHEPFRDIVTIKPGEQTRLRPSMRQVEEPERSLRSVLTTLDVDNVDVQPRDLDVPHNKTIVLDSTHEPYAKDWQVVSLPDVDTAKRIIGVSDTQWGVNAPRYGSLAERAEFTPNGVSAAAAKEYIFGNAASVADWKQSINAEIFKERWRFSIFVYGIVTIHAGGVLRLTDNSSFFTCEKLRMHTTAKLEVRGKGPGLIWPLSYESFCVD